MADTPQLAHCVARQVLIGDLLSPHLPYRSRLLWRQQYEYALEIAARRYYSHLTRAAPSPSWTWSDGGDPVPE